MHSSQFCQDPLFGPKKIPVIPVLCREKTRVGRSERIFFKYFFSWFWWVFVCWVIFSTVPTSILTRDVYFLWTNLGNLVQ